MYKLKGMEVTQNVQPWHSMYIGLGFEDNPYGIYYKDECGIAKAKSINPVAEYHSEEYFQILKEEYFKILKNDPQWVLKGYIKKVILCIISSIKCFLYFWGISNILKIVFLCLVLLCIYSYNGRNCLLL